MRFVLIGDSQGQGLWPHLAPLLTAAGHTVAFSRAQPGWEVRKYLSDPDIRRQIQSAHADAAVLSLGGNNWDLPSGSKYLSAAETFVDLLRQAGVRDVTWLSPATATDPTTARRHQATAELERGPLESTGVNWVDTRPMTMEGHADGVHFSPRKYAAWARELLPYILREESISSLAREQDRMGALPGSAMSTGVWSSHPDDFPSGPPSVRPGGPWALLGTWVSGQAAASYLEVKPEAVSGLKAVESRADRQAPGWRIVVTPLFKSRAGDRVIVEWLRFPSDWLADFAKGPIGPDGEPAWWQVLLRVGSEDRGGALLDARAEIRQKYGPSDLPRVTLTVASDRPFPGHYGATSADTVYAWSSRDNQVSSVYQVVSPVDLDAVLSHSHSMERPVGGQVKTTILATLPDGWSLVEWLSFPFSQEWAGSADGLVPRLAGGSTDYSKDLVAARAIATEKARQGHPAVVYGAGRNDHDRIGQPWSSEDRNVEATFYVRGKDEAKVSVTPSRPGWTRRVTLLSTLPKDRALIEVLDVRPTIRLDRNPLGPGPAVIGARVDYTPKLHAIRVSTIEAAQRRESGHELAPTRARYGEDRSMARFGQEAPPPPVSIGGPSSDAWIAGALGLAGLAAIFS